MWLNYDSYNPAHVFFLKLVKNTRMRALHIIKSGAGRSARKVFGLAC